MAHQIYGVLNAQGVFIEISYDLYVVQLYAREENIDTIYQRNSDYYQVFPHMKYQNGKWEAYNGESEEYATKTVAIQQLVSELLDDVKVNSIGKLHEVLSSNLFKDVLEDYDPQKNKYMYPKAILAGLLLSELYQLQGHGTSLEKEIKGIIRKVRYIV